MAAAWQSAPIVEQPEQRPQQGRQPAWMSAPAVDEAPAAEEAPRGLQMPEPEVASAEPAEAPTSRQPRGLLGVPAGSFTAEAQSVASEPVERYLGWEELAASDAFQEADLRQRHDLRAEFFRNNVADGLEGEERREAERAFHRETGTLGYEAEPRGLSTWESGSTGRRPTESMEDARERAVEIGQPGEDGELPLGEELLRGLQNAGRGVMESFYGTQAMMADDEDERQRMLDKARELRAVSEKNQATMPNFTEIRSPGDAARWAIHGIGAMAPSVGSIMAGGAAGGKAGGLVGAAAGPKGAALGAIAGSTIGSFSAGYMLYAGGLYGDIRQQGGEHEAARNSALKWGAPASAVSIVMPMAFLGSVSGYLGKDFVRGRVRNMLIGAGLGGVGEGSAEAMAEAFTIMGEEEVLGRTLTDEERRSRIINAGAAGGLMGTSMGAVGGGVQQQGNLDTMLDGFIADMERAYSEGASEDVRQAAIATLESAESLTGNQKAMLDYLRTEQADSNRPLNQELKEVQEIALSVYQRDDATNLDRFTELAERQANGELTGTEGLELIALQVNSPGVREALSQEAEAQVEGDPAAQQQATQDIADWEAQWREHEQQHGLAPIDLQQDTGIVAEVGGQAPAEPAGLQGVPEATEAAAPATDEVAGLLRTAPMANEPPAITRARDSLVAGDSFAFMQSRAEGNPEATAALEQMQQAMVEAEQAESQDLAAQKREEAASAYLTARAALEGQPATGLQMPETQAAEPVAPEAPAAPQQDVAAEPQPLQQAPDQPSAEPGRLRPRVVPVEQIQVDPQAYQFRTEVNERGVDSRLDGVQEWDDLRAGNIVLHERTDGRVFVADGHHRVDLARQLQQPDVNAIVLREADGVTVEDARREAALANIAADSATAIDAAKVFRDSEGGMEEVARRHNLPRTQLVRDGADVARLDTEAFGAVLNKVVSEKDGAAIGRAFDDADQQLAAIDIFRQVQPQNDNQRALLVNEIRQAGFAQGQSDQMGMFGDDPMQSLIGERVRVMDRLRQELSRDRRLFATLNNNAQTAEAAGNRIATERNEQLSDTAAQAIALLERATTTPEINQQINDAARRVSEGETVAPVVRELKEALLRGNDTGATQPASSPAPGQRQAAQAGQEPGGGEQVSGRDDARAARAGEQRLGDGAGETEAQGVTLKADGTPFQTERAVQLSKRFRDTPGAVAVEVDGGWGFTVQDVAQESPAPAETAQTAAQPDVDVADTSAQRVEESPVDRQASRRDRVADRLQRRTRTALGGAEAGDTVAFERDAGYARANTPYRVLEYTVNGEARLENVETGGRTTVGAAEAEAAGATVSPDIEALALETQTEESLAAREQEAQAAEQAEAESRRQEAQRAQADRDADDFLLTGSDSAADQAMARGQDSLFRLEPPADVAARRNAIAEAIGQHPELAGVQPVARVAELPADVQITMLVQGIDPRSVRGVFVGGELYVVAENVTDTADGVRVAVHEAVGHHGVRQVLGDRLTPVMNRLYLSFPRDHEVFQQVRERYPHIDTRTPEGRQEFAEELVAHLAETNPQVNAWQRFVAQVREILRQVFPEVAWTENDVRALIQRSRDTLAEQALADGTFVAEEGDTRFSLSEAPGEPRSLDGATTREEVESRLMQGMTQQERAELFSDAEWAEIVDAAMAETAQPAEAPQISELQQQLQDEHPGLELFTTQRGDVATIQRIELPAEQREQGAGTQIMEQITGWADENAITLALTPTADFGGTVGRLRDFYQRHGFADNTGRSRDHAIGEAMVRRPAGSEDVRFDIGQQPAPPTAEQVTEGLQGVEGLGRPAVLDTADQLDLDTGLRLTLRGINPQEVVAFTDDAGRLQVIAGNAESPQAAVSAAVMERIRQQGIVSVLGDRLNTIGRRADQATNLDKDGRAVRRAVRAEYPFLDPGIPGDQAAMALEVVSRLNERGDAPTFAVEALQEIRMLLAERLGVTDAADLGRASRAYLDKMLRDYGGTRPPTANGFALSLQDAPGYGTLLDMQAQVIDADGQMISDARLETGFSINPLKNAYRLIASQSDRLRDSGSRPLIELGNRIDRFFDNEDRRLGEINRIMKPALDKMNSGGRRQRKQNARDFEQYWRDWDNGRREAARAIYDGNPAVAAMVDASVELFHETGLENQSVKTPNRTGLWVHDGKRFRKIGKVRKGEFWPRQLRREVQEVIQDPSADQALWRELLDAMVDGGFAKDRQDAATQLRDRDSGRFNEQVSNDYFAGIEKARGEKLPEIFYDYSLDVVRHYVNQWARRISQVEQFGQKLRPTELDAFDEAHKLAADHRTKEYIGQVRNVVYGERNVGMAGTFASNANVLATGLHLTNYATAAQNFMTGSALNVQMFGSQRVLKAYIDLAADFSNLYREGLEVGILGKDLMNLMRDAERNNVGVFGADSQTGRFGKIMQQVTGNRMTMSEAIREFTRLGMKYGGYNGTEQLIRANAFVAAKAQLRDALDLWNRSPMSLDARRYRRFMQRNRIDVDALIRENGKGEETARYLRLMVNLPQGSYRADQAPLIIDTQVGRFFGKYQKFGTQTSRLFWQQRIKPFIELMQDANATPAERARAAFDIFHYVGWGLVGGYTNRLVRNTLFGMMFVGPDWDEIVERFRDEDYGLAWAYVLDMAFNNAMSAGSIFGFFGSPMQMAKDFRDGQRVKNPLEPPSLAVFHGMAGLATKFTQQGYSLTGQDVLDAILREYSLPRQIERTAATVADVAGVEPVGIRALDFEIERLQAEMVRRDTNYVRSAARRWADAERIEARQSGSFSPGSTPNTPANNRIHRAIQLGNHAQARALIQEEMRGLSEEEAKRRELSIKATIRARHPLRLASNTMNQEQRLIFMHWAKRNLPESRFQTIEEVVRSYDDTVQRTGLGPSPW